ncbi:FecR family protein [Pedobacter steynii]|nr:FecR family protein [Pedobacter steynii]
MMNQKLPYLLNQYLNEKCSLEELAEFYELVDDPANEKELSDLLDDAINTSTDEKQLTANQESDLLQYIFDYKESQKQQSVAVRSWDYRSWSAAAVIFLILCLGLYYFKSDRFVKEDTAVLIVPGGDKALLTLADGKVINLQNARNGELAEVSGVKIVKTGEGQLIYRISGGADQVKTSQNTISTPRGGQYTLTLPDGTKVWLNAASSLKFPTAFSKVNERKVALSGEAYFEVAKLKNPFIVTTDQQKVEVLGTHFDINAYPDEPHTRTTLLEGSIRVSSLKTGHEVTLSPGEASILKPAGLSVQKADMERNTDWKNGVFIFKNESLEEIMRKLARWYDVEVVYEPGAPRQETFSGSVSKYDHISKVLRKLELTGEVRFKIQGKKITVLK